MGRRLLIAASALAAGCVSPPWLESEDAVGPRDSGYWLGECDATWCVDADGDFHGDCSAGVLGIEDPTPEQCEGYAPTRDGEDCDDTRSSVNPWAEERCNGIDDNCNGRIDDNPPNPTTYWYADEDGDGWGGDSEGFDGCETQPPGGAPYGGDCDDADPDVHPQAFEWNDGSDWNCVDEGSTSGSWPEQPISWLFTLEDDNYHLYSAMDAVVEDGSGASVVVVGAPGVSLNGYLDGVVYLLRDPALGASLSTADALLHGAPEDGAGALVTLVGGLDSVAVWASGADGGAGAVYVSHQPEGEVALATAADATWRVQDPDVTYQIALTAGDVTADGVEEILLGLPAGVHVLPADAVGTQTLSSASGRLTLPASQAYFIDLVTLDADADGVADALISTHADYPNYDEGTVYLALSDTLGTFATLADADATLTDTFGTEARLGTVLAAGDADADGDDDVLVGAPFYATRGGALLYTTALAGAVAADTADAAFLGDFGSETGTSVEMADFDGDGGADVFVNGGAFLGATTGQYAFPDEADALLSGIWNSPYLNGARPVADLDGDGREDLVLGGVGYWDSWQSTATYGLGFVAGQAP